MFSLGRTPGAALRAVVFGFGLRYHARRAPVLVLHWSVQGAIVLACSISPVCLLLLLPSLSALPLLWSSSALSSWFCLSALFSFPGFSVPFSPPGSPFPFRLGRLVCGCVCVCFWFSLSSFFHFLLRLPSAFNSSFALQLVFLRMH